MEETVEKDNESNKLAIFCRPTTICEPVTILMSANESMTANDLKRILLKSLHKSKSKLNRVSMSKISKENHYHLLMGNCSIKGTKAMNKYIYAFEITFIKENYYCKRCKCKYILKLKFHKNCLNFVMLCDKCLNSYDSLEIAFQCPVCRKDVTRKDFITIDKRSSAISIVNIPITLSDITDITATNYLQKNPYRLTYLPFTFENHTKGISNNISVHFLDTKDHQCSSSCYYENDCLPDYKLLKSSHEQFPTLFDSHNSCLEFLNNDNIENDLDLNVDENIALKNGNLQIDQSQNTLNVDKDVDDKTTDLEKSVLQFLPTEFYSLIHESQVNVVNEKLIDSSQREQKRSSDKTELNVLDCFNEKSKVILDSIVKKLNEIEEIAKNLRINRSRRNINPFENLQYSGRSDFTHPVRFIENFNYFANQEGLNDYEKQYFLGQSLINEAAEWLKIHGYNETFENMRISFLNYFWNKQDQNRFLLFLKHGKYIEQSAKLSPSLYFYKYANESKFLDNTLNDEIVINWLIEHFDIYIRTKLYGTHTKTIDDIFQILTDLEINDINQNNSKVELPLNFFSISSSRKSRNGTWSDCLSNKYDIIQKEKQISYRCTTTKLWPMHTLSYNNPMSEMRYFNVSCDDDAMNILNDVPEKLYRIFTIFSDIKEINDYEVLGPVTIAKQNGSQLIVSTCSTFKTHENLIAGQLLYYLRDDSLKPCGIVTCSIFEGLEYRYVISNKNEKIACLLCKEKIDEINFSDNRTTAVNDLIVRYYEQKFFKKKHILRFLNENFSTIYTVWDKAVERYDPLNPNYH